MNLKEILKTKKGTAVELLIFFIVALSTLPMFLSAVILFPLAFTSLGIRNIEWKQIGFDFKDFGIKKIGIGIAVAVLYHYADEYLIDPVASKFAPPGLPEIFSMKGNVNKLIIGLILSWTTAAFLEEILFRGYLLNRLTDLIGETFLTRIIIVLLTGIAFGFVHSYQGLNGAISAGFIGVFQAAVCFLNRKKLTIPIIAHGAFDTIGFTLLFIG
jgi:membrane protease YdiL (CAAX protease family)